MHLSEGGFLHCVARPSPSASELIGVGLADLPRPVANCFVGDGDATLSQEFLDIAIAKAKAEVEPDRRTDNPLRETKTGVR